MSTGKLAAKKAKARERTFNFHQKESCQYKKNHPDILSAMRHAEWCHRNTGDPYVMYQCDRGHLHVGRLGSEESILMYGPWAENVRELQGGLNV